MTRYFNVNWRSIIARTLIATLVVINVVSVAHADDIKFSADNSQLIHTIETPSHSEIGGVHDNQIEHSDSGECHPTVCQISTLNTSPSQTGLSHIALRFYHASDQWVSTFSTSLDRPPILFI